MGPILDKLQPSINVILAEDHHVVRHGIRTLLENCDDITITGEASNGNDVFKLLEAGVPADIVITDINMPIMGGIELIEKLSGDRYHLKVMILSMVDNEKFLMKALRAGAAGFLLKSVAPDELIFAVRHIYSGNEYICSELTGKIVKTLLKRPLSPELDTMAGVQFSEREVDVLKLLADGLTNQEIADRLFTSKRTIEGYRETMITKAGVRNTVALIRYAISNNVIA